LHHGCYCPPHVGHYNSILHAIKDLESDVAIIRSVGSEDPKYSRHGITVNESQEIWREWASFLKQQIKDETGRDCDIFVEKDISPSQIPNTVKRVYWLSIKESEEEYEKNKNKHKTGIKICGSQMPNVDRDKIYQAVFQRDMSSGISATRFVECLLDRGRDCSRFVPERVDGNNYIEYLRAHDLWAHLQEEEVKENVVKTIPNKNSFWGSALSSLINTRSRDE
jgi:hypothetical protein